MAPLRGAGGYTYIEDACGEYRRPFSFILPVSVNNLGEVWLENLGAILGYLGERMGYLGRAWREVETLLAAWGVPGA